MYTLAWCVQTQTVSNLRAPQITQAKKDRQPKSARLRAVAARTAIAETLGRNGVQVVTCHFATLRACTPTLVLCVCLPRQAQS